MARGLKDLRISLQRDFPKVRPENTVGEYAVSQKEQKSIKIYPRWDVAGNSPAIKVADYYQKLHYIEDQLAKKREEAKEKRQQLDAQWKELEEKEESFKTNFMRFNKFVRENEEKRERAGNKIQDDIERIQKKDVEIAALQEKYDEMMKVKLHMESQIKRHKLYEDYLYSAVEESTEFKGVDDILSRYEALIDARQQLIERQEKDLSALENAHSDMMNVIEDKSFAIMGLQNHLANLEGRYDRAKNKALHWETVVTQIKDYAATKLTDINQVRTTCWNIYLQICKRKKKEPEFQEWDVENQLLMIKSTMWELAKIARLAKRRASRSYYRSTK